MVRTPNGHAFLIGTVGRLEHGVESAGISGAEDSGTRIVVPFLIRSDIHRLDASVFSHHGDHIEARWRRSEQFPILPER